jgi:hypothetical protein
VVHEVLVQVGQPVDRAPPCGWSGTHPCNQDLEAERGPGSLHHAVEVLGEWWGDEADRGVRSVLSYEEVSGEVARVPPFAKGCGVLATFGEQIAECEAFGSLRR